MRQHNLRFAVQGSCYKDLVLFQEDAEKIEFSELKALGVNKKNFYSDARHSRVICHGVFQNVKQEPLDVLPAAA